MRKALGTLALVLALTGLGGLPAMATIKQSGIICGNNACVETWKVTCAGSTFMRARVRDTSDNDDTLMVTLVGLTPAALNGRSDAEVAFTPGQRSLDAIIASNRNGTLSAFAIVTVFSNTGGSNYEIDAVCQKADGTFVDPTALAIVQNE